MKVFLLPGRLTYRDYLEMIGGVSGVTICGVLVRGIDTSSDWDPEQTGLPTWTYAQLVEGDARLQAAPQYDRYGQVLSRILADPRSFYMIDRLFGKAGLVSIFNNTVTMEKIVWNSLTMLEAAKPDRLTGGNTAHNLDWFVSRAAELIGVDVCFTQTSPLPARTWVVRGMDDQAPVIPESAADLRRNGPSEAVAGFIRNVRSHYDVAIPDYEKQRMEKYKKRFFSFRVEIKSILASPSFTAFVGRAHSAVRKRLALRSYNRFSGRFAAPEKFVAFFLHFQPERTTLPEGNRYVQQWLAIRLLSAALPQGWSLVVKEHPSTFRNVFIPSVRGVDFYEAIAALPNTMLAPLEMSPFVLIDKASAVATVTGTVGLEALIRGKPVLAFGAAQYRGAKGVFVADSITGVHKVLQQVDSGGLVPTDEELTDYLCHVERSSFPRDRRINGSLAAMRWALTC